MRLASVTSQLHVRAVVRCHRQMPIATTRGSAVSLRIAAAAYKTSSASEDQPLQLLVDSCRGPRRGTRIRPRGTGPHYRAGARAFINPFDLSQWNRQIRGIGNVPEDRAPGCLAVQADCGRKSFGKKQGSHCARKKPGQAHIDTPITAQTDECEDFAVTRFRTISDTFDISESPNRRNHELRCDGRQRG